MAEYEAEQAAWKERERKGRQQVGNREKPGERMEQTEEVREVREIGPGGDQDQTRWVPTHPTSHSQPTPQTYETPYGPPVDATSLGDGSIDHRDSPDHTGRCQLPTPTAHPELERQAYETYPAATPYDDDSVVMSNRGDIPPSWFHTQPPPGRATTVPTTRSRRVPPNKQP
jgi:hypothetical protein